MPSIDLNLLTVLDALLQEGSVTGAAKRLNLTPPGVSRSLGRLRSITGDPLLVRTGRKLIPTPAAEALRERAHEVLEEVHEILTPRVDQTDEDIERTLELTFTIQAGADSAELFGPAVMRVIRARTRKPKLKFLADGPLNVQELPGGKLDLYIGLPLPADVSNIYRERLLSDQMVLVGRKDGMLGKFAPGQAPSLEELAEVPHITANRQGVLRSPVDEHFEANGLLRDVVASTPGFTSAFTMLRSSDFICLAPEGLTRDLLGDDLITRPSVIPLPPVFIEMAWHRRTHTDPAQRWLRDRVREATLSTCPTEQQRIRHLAEQSVA